MAAGRIDHDPLPGQPAGLAGAEYVVSTMHGAQPDLRFSIDDLIAERDRVTFRWTLHGPTPPPCSDGHQPARPPGSRPS
jgi:predicted ester cyclase